MGQFKALLTKNWILWKRNLFCNFVEILVPFLLILFLSAIRSLIEIENFEEQQFLTNPNFTRTLYGDVPTTLLASSVPILKNCTSGEIVGIGPSGNPMALDLAAKFQAANYSTQLFASNDAMDEYVRSLDYGVGLNKFCFAVYVEESNLAGQYRYDIRFNESTRSESTDGPATDLLLEVDQALNLNLFTRSMSRGMLQTTTMVNDQILKREAGNNNAVLEHTVGPIYQEWYVLDTIYTTARQNVAILFLLPLLIIYLRLTSTMLSEKETKVRETMSIMGMRLELYYVTWSLRYFLTFFLLHLFGSLVVSSVLPHVGFIYPFVIFLLFDTVLILQSFFIQIFFSRAKLGVVIALLFFLIQYILSFVVINSDNPTEAVNTALSIVPHIAFIISFETMIYAEEVKVPINFTDSLNFYTLSTAVGFLILNIVFWLIVTWYLEQVVPNEFGTRKHPLWCCMDKKNSNTATNFNEEGTSNHLSDFEKSQEEIEKNDSKVKRKKSSENIESVDQKYLVQERQKKILELTNLRK